MKIFERTIPKVGTITYKLGENAEDNFKIIDEADPKDIWFHVHNQPSCHVIATIPEGIDRKNIKYIITQGALVLKENSKFKSVKKLEIVYARIKNVTKTEPVGSVNVTEETIIKI
jgi:predicted ribosome quality control (RQC) complex YloA/Tae2 family protein